MNDLRTAAQQALEALWHGVKRLNHRGGTVECLPLHDAITALKAALAEPVQAKFDDVAVEQWKLRMVFYDENGEPLMSRQPEPDEILAALTEPAEPVQEPVAWADKISFENAMKTGKGHDVWPKAGDYVARTGRALIGLYTAPPQRKPLPASEIVTMYDESPRGDSDMIAFARAVERAHGIKE